MKIIERSELAEEKVEHVESTSHWIEVAELPSKFLSYPAGSRIQYKPYSFGELEEWASLPKGASPEDKYRLGLKGIKVTGFDIWDLNISDYNYIMTLRKLSTYDRARFDLKYVCPHCEESVVSTQEIQNVSFKDFEEFDHLPITYRTSDGKELVIDSMTVGDAIRFRGAEIPDNSMTRLAFQVRNMETTEALNYLSDITDVDDMELLQELEGILNFGKSQEIDLVCPHCRKKSTISILGVSALAEPFRKSKKSLHDRIVSR